MSRPTRFCLLILIAQLAIRTTSSSTALAVSLYWDGTGTGWNTTNSWSTASAAATPDPASVPVAADIAIFNISSLASNQTVNLNAPQSALGLIFNSIGTIAFQNGTGTNALTIGASGIIVNSGTGTVTASSAVILAAAQTWTNNSTSPLTAGNLVLGANPLTFSGTGSGGFTFTGAVSGDGALTISSGSARLSGTTANSFTGTTTVNGGTLTLNKTAANSTIVGSLIIGDGVGGPNADVVSVTASNQISDTSAVTINSSGSLQCAAAQEYVATITMNGGNVSTSGIGSISAATFNTNANTVTAAITGSLNLNGTTMADVSAGTTAAGIDLDIQAAVTNGTLLKDGPGVMRLSGSADNTGTALNIVNGTVLLAKSSSPSVHAVGTGGLAISGGTAQLAATGGDQVLNSAVVSAGSALATGTFDTRGQNETFAVLNLNGNGIGDNGALQNSSGSSALTVTTATNLNADSSIGVASGANITLDTAISGNYGWTKVGAGTLTLTGSGVNALTGTTIVNGGVLVLSKTLAAAAIPGNVSINSGGTMRLGADHQVADTSNISISAGGTFDISTFKENVARVVLNGGSITGSAGELRLLAQDALIANASSSTATISGQLFLPNSAGSTIDVAAGTTSTGVDLDISASTSWSGVLTKNGAGSMRMSGPNLSSAGFTMNGGTLLVANNAALGSSTITLNSGAMAADGAARTLSNAVVVPTGANATLTGSYDITLSGAISGGGRLTKIGNAMLTLTGANTFSGPVNVNGGSVALGGGSLSANLVNSATFVYNAGAFSGRLTNAGSMTFNADFTAANGLENDATFSIASGRAITLNGLGLDNEGALSMAGGTLNLSTAPSAANVNRGTFNLSPTIPFNLNGATLSNNGTLNLNTGTVTGASGLLSNGVGGAITGSGAILSPFVNAGGLVVIASGTTNMAQSFANSGYIQLLAPTSNLSGGSITTSGAIDGIGAIGNNIINTGTIEAIGGTLTLGGSVTNIAPGRILAPSGARVLITGTASNNSGTINLSGGTIEFTQAATNTAIGTISGRGALITSGTGLANNGNITFSGGATDVFGKLTNSTGLSTKGVTISPGAVASFWGEVTNAAGSLFRVSTGSSANFYGKYAGAGITGGGQLNFGAEVSPGFSPANTSFAANVALGSTAKLLIELGGTTPGTQFDQMQVTGLLTLDGALQASLINNFIPAAGNSFDILHWSSISGTFSTLQLPTLPAALQWNTSQLYTTGTLSVTQATLPGDFDHNGLIDAADYIMFRKGTGAIYSPSDYELWRIHFGQSAGAAATIHAAVPEPTFLGFAIAFALLVQPSSRRISFR